MRVRRARVTVRQRGSCWRPSTRSHRKPVARGRAAGAFPGAPVDLADGFIHFSTAEQVTETAARHFAGQDDLVLVAVDAAALGPALRNEPSRGGALFPHLYGALPLDAVLWVKPLPLGADGPYLSGARRVIGLFDRLPRRCCAGSIRRTRTRSRSARSSSRRCRAPRRTMRSCACEAFGLKFPNPVGMAAGFDKNAEVPDGCSGSASASSRSAP